MGYMDSVEKEKTQKEKGKLPFRVGVSTKVAIALFLIGFVPLAIFGSIYVRNEEERIVSDTFSKLALLAESKETVILEYFKDIAQRTMDFSSDGFIRDETARIVRGGSAERGEALSRHLLVNKKPLEPTLAGIFILNENGIIIASTDPKDIGRNESYDQYFIEGRGKTTMVRTDPGDVHFGVVSPFVVGVPLTDKDTHEFIGVIVTVFNPRLLEETLATNIVGRSDIELIAEGSAEALHVYVVDHEKNVILHPIRKEIDPSRDIDLKTLPVVKCIDGGEEVLGEYIDHDGKEVLGASMCMEERGMVLIADLEKDVAVLPVDQARARFYFLMTGVVGLIIIFSFFASRMLTKPLRTLKESADIIRAGNLRHRVGILGTGDEIEELSRAFDAMTTAIEDGVRIAVEEKQKFITLIEHLPVGVFMIKAPEGDLAVANPRSVELFGQDNDFLNKPHTLSELFRIIKPMREDGAPFAESEIPVFIALHEGRIVERNDIMIVGKNEKKMTLRVIGVPVKDVGGSVIYALMVFDDITKEREIDRAKTEFVSLASHQLRTPLSTINWYSEMLLAEDVGPITPDQKSYLEEIYKGNQRMVGLVNALLNVSRIEMGTFAAEVRKIDLIAEADLVLNEFAVMAGQRNITITREYAEKSIFIDADRKMVQMIFQNLISNAIKYTPDGGGVAVRIRREEEDNAHIEISDTGYGIPKHQYDKIFTKLFRADNIVYKDTEGTGLGLYLVKLVVGQLGGKIWFVSEENKGSTFFVVLPAHKHEEKHE